MKILVVEGEPLLAESICKHLRKSYYAVDLATDGSRAAELMDLEDYDTVVLDRHIPPQCGLDLLRRWRGSGQQVPVLLLTSRNSAEDRIEGLDCGADDVLTLPFAFPEFLARVRSLLRRRTKPLNPELMAGDLRMDRARAQVTLAGKPVSLRPKEFTLLEYFLRRQNEVVTRQEIETHVWDSAFDSLGNVVEVTVHRLRKKIETLDQKRLLHTIRGKGYMLRSERA